MNFKLPTHTLAHTRIHTHTHAAGAPSETRRNRLASMTARGRARGRRVGHVLLFFFGFSLFFFFLVNMYLNVERELHMRYASANYLDCQWAENVVGQIKL